MTVSLLLPLQLLSAVPSAAAKSQIMRRFKRNTSCQDATGGTSLRCLGSEPDIVASTMATGKALRTRVARGYRSGMIDDPAPATGIHRSGARPGASCSGCPGVIFQSHDCRLAMVGVAIMIAVEEPCSDLPQIALPDWFAAQRTEGSRTGASCRLPKRISCGGSQCGLKSAQPSLVGLLAGLEAIGALP
jgi:hypothetical protein